MLLDEDKANRKLGYFVLFQDEQFIRRIVTRVCKSFMGAVYETSLQTVLSDLAEANAQKNSIRQLIAQSKMNFVDYLTQYNPLKDAEDLSTILIYKHFV